jgi:antitoxin component YwqK of YwqJK toxin-antitoxin module
MIKKLLARLLPRKPKNGKWKEFNKHAILISEGHYKNDLKQGIWRYYYDSGELVIEESYNNDVLQGKYSAYHINGQRMSEGYYSNGLREGYFHVYDEGGNLIKIILFLHDIVVEETEISEMDAVHITRNYGT